VQEFVYQTSDDVVQLTFETLDAGGDVDLLVRRGAAIGLPQNATYSSRRPGSMNEAIVLTPGSAPVPLAGAAPWHAAVQNVSGHDSLYFIKATEARQDSIQILPVNTTFTRTNLAPLEIDYFRVTVPADASHALFNLAVISGEADLYIKRDAFPTTTLYDFESVMAGSDYYLASSSTLPPLTPGEWRLAVANSSAALGSSYDLSVLISTNGIPGEAFSLHHSGASYSAEGFALRWNAPSGQEFRVEYTDTLPPQWQPLPGSVVSINGECTFFAPGPQGSAQRFYRLVRIR
jgi:hypothetical protein